MENEFLKELEIFLADQNCRILEVIANADRDVVLGYVFTTPDLTRITVQITKESAETF